MVVIRTQGDSHYSKHVYCAMNHLRVGPDLTSSLGSISPKQLQKQLLVVVHIAVLLYSFHGWEKHESEKMGDTF